MATSLHAHALHSLRDLIRHVNSGRRGREGAAKVRGVDEELGDVQFGSAFFDGSRIRQEWNYRVPSKQLVPERSAEECTAEF